MQTKRNYDSTKQQEDFIDVEKSLYQFQETYNIYY